MELRRHPRLIKLLITWGEKYVFAKVKNTVFKVEVAAFKGFLFQATYFTVNPTFSKFFL